MAKDYVNLSALRATIYSILAVVTVVTAVRLYRPLRQPSTFQFEDAWMIVAYVWFLTLSVMYIVIAPPMLRVQDALSEKTPKYKEMTDDSFLVKKSLFFAAPFFWFCLWSVKFSLLALYKRFTNGLKLYTRIWWGVAAFCTMVCPPSIPFSRRGC